MSIPREVKLIGSSMPAIAIAIACHSWAFDIPEESRTADGKQSLVSAGGGVNH